MTETNNRSIRISEEEIEKYGKRLVRLKSYSSTEEIINKTIHGDLFEAVEYLPEKFVDLLFMDPPYNMDKKFNSNKFKSMSVIDYAEWIDSYMSKLIKILKPDASIYFCGDWRSSTSIHLVLEKYFKIQNRITFEREKGRGAKRNWKNNSEDIWFCTMNNNYTFNVDDVKLKRRVIAPYKDEEGNPKDWKKETDGSYRLTYPSNIWTDISIPFWSMPENTEHPTQKPEKLLAKIILASSNPGDVVFDPFLGSGTSSVVAKKLGRKFCGIEKDLKYAAIAEKRLEIAETNKEIQGYFEGVFWERNSIKNVKKR